MKARVPAVGRAAQPGTRVEALTRLASEHWNRVAQDDARFTVVTACSGVALIAVWVAAARVLGRDFPSFLFACSVLIAAVGLIRPYVAVLGAILVSPTFAWAVFGPDVSAFQVLVAGAAAGCLWQLHSERAVARRLATRPEVVVSVVFITWLVFAALVRRDVSDWGFVRNYVGAVVFLGVVALTLRTGRRRATAIGALMIGTSATALVGLAQIFTTEALVSGWVLPDVDVVRQTYTRMGSAWGLASVGSDYGKDVLVGFLLAMPLALRGVAGRSRVPFAIVAGILGLGLLMSGGRSAWLGGVIGLGYLVVALRGRREVVLLAALAAGLIALILNPSAPVEIQTTIGLAPQGLRAGVVEPERIQPSSSPSPRFVVGGVRDALSVERSSNLRRRLTVAALEMVRDEPVVGVGAGAFKHQVDRYEPLPAIEERPLDARPNLPAHNVVLELWADSGTPAVVFYLTLLVFVFLRLERHRRERAGLTSSLGAGLGAALLGLFVTSLFHNYTYDNVLWAICGIAVSLAMFPLRESRAE